MTLSGKQSKNTTPKVEPVGVRAARIMSKGSIKAALAQYKAAIIASAITAAVTLVCAFLVFFKPSNPEQAQGGSKNLQISHVNSTGAQFVQGNSPGAAFAPPTLTGNTGTTVLSQNFYLGETPGTSNIMATLVRRLDTAETNIFLTRSEVVSITNTLVQLDKRTSDLAAC